LRSVFCDVVAGLMVGNGYDITDSNSTRTLAQSEAYDLTQ